MPGAPTVLTEQVPRADGTRLRVWRAGGDGVPVLVCNGLGTSPYAWPGLLDPGAGVAAVGWEYPGVGGSDRPADPERVTIEDHVSDALLTLDHAGYQRAVLACWSIGVNVGFEVAVQHPDRVAGILAVAGVPGGTFGTMLAPLYVPRSLRRPIATTATVVARTFGGPLTLLARAIPANDATAWLLSHSGFMLPSAQRADVRRTMGAFLEHDFRWYFRLAAAAAEHSAIDLEDVGVPVTLLAGRWDLLTAWNEVVATAARLPDAEVEVLPGSHFLPLEYPERIAADVHALAARAALP